MIITVVGLDAYLMERQLRQRFNLHTLPEFVTEITIAAKDGRCQARDSFRRVLGDGKLKIFIGEPGERCLRVDGEREDIVCVLECLGISTMSFLETMSSFEKE